MFRFKLSICTNFNPRPAAPVYIRFQTDFKPDNMSLKVDNKVCGRCLVSSGFKVHLGQNIGVFYRFIS